MSASETIRSEALWFFNRQLAFAALDRFLWLTGDPNFDTARAWNGAGLAAMHLSYYDQARRNLLRSLEAAQAAGDQRGQLRAVLNLINLDIHSGNGKEAVRRVKEAESLCAAVGDNALSLTAGVLAVAAFGLDHQATEALSRVPRVMEILGGQRPPAVLLPMYINMGVCLQALGQMEDARQVLLQAFELGQQQGEATYVAHSLTELARIALYDGNWDGAVSYGRQAIDYLWNHMGQVYKGEVARLCEIFGHMALALGDRRKGMALLERAGTYYGQLNLWREWSRVSDLQRSGLGKVALKVGELPEETVSTLHYFSDLFGLLDNIESADPTLSRRGELVTHYALLLGNQMGLPEDQMVLLSHAGRLCDIGLTTFEPEAIADEEGPRYKLHPDLSARWLEDFPLPEGTDRVVRAHHERYDGKGYPSGLSGEEIPLGARLLATCEAYVRAMQHGATHDEAMANLAREAGAALDPAVVDAFTRLHQPSAQ